MVGKEGSPEDTSSCLCCVLFPASVSSVLREEQLDALPFRDEEFVRVHISVEDDKNLLKMMVEPCRIGFLVQGFRTDVERSRIKL